MLCYFLFFAAMNTLFFGTGTEVMRIHHPIIPIIEVIYLVILIFIHAYSAISMWKNCYWEELPLCPLCGYLPKYTHNSYLFLSFIAYTWSALQFSSLLHLYLCNAMDNHSIENHDREEAA